MASQNYALYQHMSVRDNLAFGLRNRRVPEAEIEAAINRAARILSIARAKGIGLPFKENEAARSYFNLVKPSIASGTRYPTYSAVQW